MTPATGVQAPGAGRREPPLAELRQRARLAELAWTLPAPLVVVVWSILARVRAGDLVTTEEAER